MDGLCQELPAYLARQSRGEGVSFKADSMADLAAKKVEWWRQNEDSLPHWVGAVKMVLLLQPTSAEGGGGGVAGAEGLHHSVSRQWV